MQAARVRIGVDTGGTFTDVVLADDSGRPPLTHKLLSTPDDPARAVLDGIQTILGEWTSARRGDPTARPQVIHGSTVATNALLEGKGGRAAFVTTAGFEDVLWIGRQNRPELYALEPVRPEPPLDRAAVVGVDERLRFDGAVLRQLTEDNAGVAVESVGRLGVDSVSICLLHSYANPTHERLLAERLRSELPGLHVTVSSELLPEFREYERSATCLANAVVAPPMADYIGRLAAELGPGSLRVMASAGGSLPPEGVTRQPVHTILSGPAGGVLGAFHGAGSGGHSRIITFDMGGTSTDVSLCDDALTHTTESEVAGLPVRLPMIDIHTVGAGGGSVAWLDDGGALRVGPQSTGADPGPACYGRQHGELLATVTDAHLVLGHLAADQPLGQGLRLNPAAAHGAVSQLGARAGLSPAETALGILRVADATMARAVQRISVERGHDLREFTLVPFGGAGGLHAARLADYLGIGEVLVPTEPGLLSALGMLGAAPLHAFSLSVMERAAPDQLHGLPLTQLPGVVEAIAQLRARGEEALAAEGIAEPEREYHFSLDLRYEGQSYELTIPLSGEDPAAAFTRTHERLYGYSAPDKPIEVVTARLRAAGPVRPLPRQTLAARTGSDGPDVADAVFLYGDEALPAARYGRRALRPGDLLAGPAVIGEYSATTLVPVGWQALVNELGQLLLTRTGGREAQHG